MLSKCIDSGYLVGTTPLTVFHRLFWNLADVFCMESRYMYALGLGAMIIVSHFLVCELGLFSSHEMLSKCIHSGYLMGATPLTVLH